MRGGSGVGGKSGVTDPGYSLHIRGVRPGRVGRGVRRGLGHGGGVGFQEAPRLVVGSQEGIDPGSQFGVVAAFPVQELDTGGSVGLLDGEKEQGLNTFRVGGHGRDSGGGDTPQCEIEGRGCRKKFPNSSRKRINHIQARRGLTTETQRTQRENQKPDNKR